MSSAITPTEYRAFQKAYDFFNRELFGGSLPDLLITLQRHARTYGYFSPEKFTARAAAGKAHELALNPDGFNNRQDEEILSTLVHEMVHVWQQSHGTPPRRSYHDREWAAKMKAVGLQPSSTGQPGGAETGQKMSHYILPGQAFTKAFTKLRSNGFQLRWESMEVRSDAKAKTASKTKFTCPECAQNAWAKPDALLICGACYEDGEGESVLMLAEA